MGGRVCWFDGRLQHRFARSRALGLRPLQEKRCSCRNRGTAIARGSAQKMPNQLPAAIKPFCKTRMRFAIEKFFAAEPTAASGGNREARLGPRSDFCEAAQGRSIKSDKRNPTSFFQKGTKTPVRSFTLSQTQGTGTRCPWSAPGARRDVLRRRGVCASNRASWRTAPPGERQAP